MIDPIIPDNSVPIVDEEGKSLQVFTLFLIDLLNRTTLVGSGSPEGVVSAVSGRTYMDDTGTTGSILYVKKLNDISGDTTKGWILV